MNETEKSQLLALIANIEETRKIIPTFSDLENHPIFWANFRSMTADKVSQVRELINSYIAEHIFSFHKTKWWQLFARFFESQPDLFRKFRELNENTETASSPAFQTVWKQVENELFKLEWILTDKMINQEKGLDKVIEAFYNIVYLFFPRFNLLD